jgi:hypothetical protein
MALSNQYYNVDDKLVNQSIVKMLFSQEETGSSRRSGGENESERNHKSE